MKTMKNFRTRIKVFMLIALEKTYDRVNLNISLPSSHHYHHFLNGPSLRQVKPPKIKR